MLKEELIPTKDNILTFYEKLQNSSPEESEEIAGIFEASGIMVEA